MIFLARSGPPMTVMATVMATASDRRFYFLVFLVAVVWTGLSGPGGFGNQSYDYIKHNSLLRDLTFDPWPLFYDVFNQKGRGIGPDLRRVFHALLSPGGVGWKAFRLDGG